ncbi:P-loop containing nucleoside triphosphate hydrolase protein [Flagelloscypha sp. PMI_526]|nr:P-loop containing nucleoside triphosphate hydrolase protein [Flagelloscypha sp. PMI_526]
MTLAFHTLSRNPSYPNLRERLSYTKPRATRRDGTFFGHTSYKGKQKEVVEAAVKGADILVLAPTGMGKSLCFQVPALADSHGVTLVLSPLLEVQALRTKGVVVASLTSETPYAEKQEILADLILDQPRTRLLYLTPERLAGSSMLDVLDVVYENEELNRLVVDEAHCISEWGRDFRPDFRRLGTFRDRFPNVPIMALTASLHNLTSLRVQEDIIHSLKLSSEHFCKVIHPFNRSNLYYEVKCINNLDPGWRMNVIHQFIMRLYAKTNAAVTGIVYCRVRKSCDELSDYLRQKGLNARPYHKGVPDKTRDRVLKGWTEGNIDVVCSTIAFGLGINKADVRYVIHWDLPKSFEGYYQETGRAGRDGNPSRCILYYSREDALVAKRWILKDMEKQKLELRSIEDTSGGSWTAAVDSINALIQYAEGNICRHISVCRYFGEPIPDEGDEMRNSYCSNMCDNCRHPEVTKQSRKNFDITVGHSNASLRSKPGTSLGSTKRTNPFGGERDVEEAKRFRQQYAPVLYTKEHASVSSLKKPFKAPSFSRAGSVTSGPTSAKLSEAPARPHEPSILAAESTDVPDLPSADYDDVHDNAYDSRMESSDCPTNRIDCSDDAEEDIDIPIPVNLPEVELLNIKESKKIEASVRMRAAKQLHQTFHHIFASDSVWRTAGGEALNSENRMAVLRAAVVKLEWGLFSFSTSRERYERRLSAICDLVMELANPAVWDQTDEDEDREEVVLLIREFCSKH